ncbi:hypothetical protein EPI10_022819 [Gossypium australe]|uniref:Uncharacterized protein n=1 Tax=Gossypium australe TaxID=47621 RepID=A0A5B6VTR1_9ROSI|nr:hypothetical protein EPI10_022819 [Gossypium australe]
MTLETSLQPTDLHHPSPTPFWDNNFHGYLPIELFNLPTNFELTKHRSLFPNTIKFTGLIPSTLSNLSKTRIKRSQRIDSYNICNL